MTNKECMIRLTLDLGLRSFMILGPGPPVVSLTVTSKLPCEIDQLRVTESSSVIANC